MRSGLYKFMIEAWRFDIKARCMFEAISEDYYDHM